MHLNYHHLRYFWTVAREKSLTRAARALRISPSALSTQLKVLESSLNQNLFDRSQKSLQLTEAGYVALGYADTIFGAGTELLDTLSGGDAAQRRTIRIGAMATLSRNFQLQFLRPLLGREGLQLLLRSGNLRDLLTQLESMSLDMVLSTQAVRSDLNGRLNNQLIAEFPVSLVGKKSVRLAKGRFPLNLRNVPLILPGSESSMRPPFDALLAEAGVVPRVAAEVDDMAMLRLLAREGIGLALVPPVVVEDELKDGRLREVQRIPGLRKAFYAITLNRRFPNSAVKELLSAAAKKIAV